MSMMCLSDSGLNLGVYVVDVVSPSDVTGGHRFVASDI